VEFLRVDPAKSFSVIVLPDTQFYSSHYPGIFCSQTQWIVDYKDDLNIVFVSHMGDIVNDGAKEMKQWKNASKCLRKLDGIVPYSVIPGNHDTNIQSDKSSGLSMYDKFFPVLTSKRNGWYGGNFDGNRNNFEMISSNGLKLLFINLEIEPTDAVLNWANDIVRNNSTVYTIVTTHKYLDIDGKNPENKRAFSIDGNTGEDIWNKLVFDNCSIAMVLSGHFHGENKITKINSCGNDVSQIVQDYQARENGGNGWLRIYVFTPNDKKIDVYTYSPYLGKIEIDDNSSFSLGIPVDN
jgi:predicted MPP superfamily phosphohydrolase